MPAPPLCARAPPTQAPPHAHAHTRARQLTCGQGAGRGAVTVEGGDLPCTGVILWLAARRDALAGLCGGLWWGCGGVGGGGIAHTMVHASLCTHPPCAHRRAHVRQPRAARVPAPTDLDLGREHLGEGCERGGSGSVAAPGARHLGLPRWVGGWSTVFECRAQRGGGGNPNGTTEARLCKTGKTRTWMSLLGVE